MMLSAVDVLVSSVLSRQQTQFRNMQRFSTVLCCLNFTDVLFFLRERYNVINNEWMKSGGIIVRSGVESSYNINGNRSLRN